MRDGLFMRCVFCNTEFDSNRKNVKFCSENCSNKNRYALVRKERGLIMLHKNCPICGSSFTTYRKNQIYCKTACRTIVYQKCHRSENYDTQDLRARKKWCQYRIRSRHINKPFTTLKDFQEFYRTPRICTYCGITENIIVKTYSHLRKAYKKMTVDRKNNMRGYEKDNICWACMPCNQVKNYVLTYEEMLEIGTRYMKPKWEKIYKTLDRAK